MRNSKLSVYTLEKFLIPSNRWKELYSNMPQKCREVVDDRNDDPIGIGFKEGFGWFILASGQGPFIAWTEHDLDGEFINTGEF